MALTDTKVRAAKPEANEYSLVDGDGMFYWYTLTAPNTGAFVSALGANNT